VSLHHQGRLRGCIGVVETAEPLPETVIHCAIAAATQDARFRPVTREELPGIEYEVSVLAPPQAIHSASDVEIGRHGLILEAGGARALLLPQVASARGWSAEVFLDQLCRKAGLPAGRWKRDARLWTFTAQVFADSPPA
jgi:AmmeMemoRadiSam system protein A